MRLLFLMVLQYTHILCRVSEWLPSRLIPHRDRPRAELQPAHEPQVETLRQSREQRRPVTRQPGVHHELVLIDQSQLRQGERELYTSREQSLARLPLELLNGRPRSRPRDDASLRPVELHDDRSTHPM
jgi:hypothetical protein